MHGRAVVHREQRARDMATRHGFGAAAACSSRCPKFAVAQGRCSGVTASAGGGGRLRRVRPGRRAWPPARSASCSKQARGQARRQLAARCGSPGPRLPRSGRRCGRPASGAPRRPGYSVRGSAAGAAPATPGRTPSGAAHPDHASSGVLAVAARQRLHLARGGQHAHASRRAPAGPARSAPGERVVRCSRRPPMWASSRDTWRLTAEVVRPSWRAGRRKAARYPPPAPGPPFHLQHFHCRHLCVEDQQSFAF
jgi:hypothetical protein